MTEKDARQLSLIGPEALARLMAAHVVVLGLGGVGGYVAEALARAGVGRLTLVDGDVFAPSNLNRQIGCLENAIGRPKAEVMAERAGQIDPRLRVTPVIRRVGAGDLDGILGGGADYVADAIDDVAAKAALAIYCADHGVPLISCMGTGNRTGLAPFEITDIGATRGDPLARALRARLKRAGDTRLTVCWSPETPKAYEKTAVPASISYVPGLAGLTMAGHIIRNLAGIARETARTDKEGCK